MLRTHTFILIFTLCLLSCSCRWVDSLHLQPPPAPSPTLSAPTGHRVYVTDKASRVLAVKTDDNAVAEQFVVEGGAGTVMPSSDNLLLYATARSKDYIRVFQATGPPVGRINCGREPLGMDMTRDGKTAYVANKGSNTISVLDLKHRKESRQIPTGQQPLVVALSPDNSRLYVLCNQDNDVIVYNTKKMEERARVKAGVDLFGLAVDPKGQYVYVTSFDTNELVVLTADALTEVSRIRVGDGPYEVIATQSGQILVGCVEDNSVVTIDRDDWKTAPKATPVGVRPYGLGLSPDEKTLYVALEGDARVSVRALPSMEEKARLDFNLVPIDVFTGH